MLCCRYNVEKSYHKWNRKQWQMFCFNPLNFVFLRTVTEVWRAKNTCVNSFFLVFRQTFFTRHIIICDCLNYKIFKYLLDEAVKIFKKVLQVGSDVWYFLLGNKKCYFTPLCLPGGSFYWFSSMHWDSVGL